MRLDDRQLAFYRTFGFLRFPGLFADEVEEITAAFERIWVASGLTHDHRERSMIAPFADRDEYLAGLLDDPRIDGVVRSLLGPDYNYAGSDGNYYVGDTNWHSDHDLAAPYHSLKIAFYLDPVDAASGCLRVFPGSCHAGDRYADGLHRVVPLTRHNRSDEFWGMHGSDLPGYAIASTPGDMLLFNHKTKHSAWGGGTERRMFTYNFEQHMAGEALPHLVQLLRNSVDRNGTVYVEPLLRTAGRERMHHLTQRLQVAREHGLDQPQEDKHDEEPGSSL